MAVRRLGLALMLTMLLVPCAPAAAQDTATLNLPAPPEGGYAVFRGEVEGPLFSEAIAYAETTHLVPFHNVLGAYDSSISIAGDGLRDLQAGRAVVVGGVKRVAAPDPFSAEAFFAFVDLPGGEPLEPGGVELDVVTPAGTNEWRGTGRYLLRDDTWPANPPLPPEVCGPSTPLFGGTRVVDFADFGVQPSGPFIRDELWLWGSYPPQPVPGLGPDDVAVNAITAACGGGVSDAFYRAISGEGRSMATEWRPQGDDVGSNVSAGTIIANFPFDSLLFGPANQPSLLFETALADQEGSDCGTQATIVRCTLRNPVDNLLFGWRANQRLDPRATLAVGALFPGPSGGVTLQDSAVLFFDPGGGSASERCSIEPQIATGGQRAETARVRRTRPRRPPSVPAAAPGTAPRPSLNPACSAAARGCPNVVQGSDDPNSQGGGNRSDLLVGRGGNDYLRGFGGGDCVAGQMGNDTNDGGPGNDAIRDVSGINRVFGGGGRDRIDGVGYVDAGAGNDVVRGSGAVLGGGGNDRLTVFALFRNEVFAGAGNDRVDAHEGTRSFVDCGAGRDLALVDDRLDTVARNCERVRARR